MTFKQWLEKYEKQLKPYFKYKVGGSWNLFKYKEYYTEQSRVNALMASFFTNYLNDSEFIYSLGHWFVENGFNPLDKPSEEWVVLYKLSQG